MADENEELEAEGPEQGAPPAVDVVGLATERLRSLGKKDDPRLDAYLEKQTRLLDLQAEHLHEQRELQLEHLKVRRWRDRLGLSLQLLGVAAGAALVIGVGAMAWSASQDHGLVIDAFSSPPDLSEKGLTGQVAAARFLDKLQAMQTATYSDRPEQSYQNNWGADLKVQIPETGLTFNEFEKLLHDKLGHVSHVSGEVIKTPDGISLTARIGDAPPQTFTGPAGSFDDLAQKAAEAVYRASQPYRYVEYLDDHGRYDEAFAAVTDLALNGPISERGWAYSKWALMDVNDRGDTAAGLLHARRSAGYGAGSDLSGHISLVNAAVWSSHEEEDYLGSEKLEVETQKRQPGTSEDFYVENKVLALAWMSFIRPDYLTSAAYWLKTARDVPTDQWGHFNVMSPAMAATAYALNHDPAEARRQAAPLGKRDEASIMWDVGKGAFLALPTFWIAVEEGRWDAALADIKPVDTYLETHRSEHPIFRLMQQSWIWPLEALAMARTGDQAGAEALIGKTALDCYLCLRVRGQMAAQAKDWAGAERWFAEAARQAPHVPQAFSEWGQMRLDKGDADGAIAKLEIAHRLGARFADPLELWGEALMKKGDFAGAADKFAEAARIAPNWRRNRELMAQAKAKAHG